MTPICTPERLLDLAATDTYNAVMSIQTTRAKQILEAARNMPKLESATYLQISKYLTEHNVELTAEQVEQTLAIFPDVIINIHLNGFGDTEVNESILNAISVFYLGTEYHHELDPLIASQVLNVWQAPMPDWRDVKNFYQVRGECEVCGSQHQIGSEPRFAYKVCELHSALSPIEVSRRSKERAATKKG